MVHSHHNHAWREPHAERDLWVVRKGATPAVPDQWGFVGGSMGGDAVILDRVETPDSRSSLHSPVHGAGRRFGRQEAKRRFARAEMDARRVACSSQTAGIVPDLARAGSLRREKTLHRSDWNEAATNDRLISDLHRHIPQVCG